MPLVDNDAAELTVWSENGFMYSAISFENSNTATRIPVRVTAMAALRSTGFFMHGTASMPAIT